MDNKSEGYSSAQVEHTQKSRRRRLDESTTLHTRKSRDKIAQTNTEENELAGQEQGQHGEDSNQYLQQRCHASTAKDKEEVQRRQQVYSVRLASEGEGPKDQTGE